MSYSVFFELYFVTSLERFCTTPNASTPAYYLSLVALNAYGSISDPNMGQIIWTVNEGEPVSLHACLHLGYGEDSNLKLVEYFDNIRAPKVVWQTDTANKTTDASLVITYEGNLVLFSNNTDPPFVPLWESFQHPTNTLMVLQVLQENSTLTIRNDANSGSYTMVIENGSLVLYARIWDQDESKYGSPYWVWPDHRGGSPPAEMTFVALCWDSFNFEQLRLYAGSNWSENSTVSPETCLSVPHSNEPSERVMNIHLPSKVTFATFMSLDEDGDFRVHTVNDTSFLGEAVWSELYSVFSDTACSLPLYCGFYGMCDQQLKHGNYSYNCTCDHINFKPADPSNNRSGCTLKDGHRELPMKGSVCTTPSHRMVDFVQIQNVHYFSLDFTDPLHDINDEQTCIRNCSDDCNCTAVFWDTRAFKCFPIRGQLGTIQRQQGNMSVFIKYLYPKKPTNWKLFGSLVAATTFAFIIACIFFLYLCKRRRLHLLRSAELENERLLLSIIDSNITERFTWKQMHEYTCGFSDLLGEGGFGRIFRGSLPDGTVIAVKQLDEYGSYEGRGNKEFIAEVSILSRINHAHLVRLIGFCWEGVHKLLAYEYMENGSLDAWIFRNPFSLEEVQLNEPHNNKRKVVLPWHTRFQIALGTAKGLAYLHEECEEKVIHMDFKPQNILLGRNFLAKISDFGMSRRTNREQSSVVTVMRGTPGYLAPEWLLDTAITEKCDVYSFGIVLLEMVSGKKVRDLKELKKKLGMRSLRESVMMDFADENLRYNHNYGSDLKEEETMIRMVEVALLCVRKDPVKRPAMSSVALMLEGKVEVQQAALDDGYGDDDDDDAGLSMYPSTINKNVRIRRNFDSFTTNAGDSGNNVWSSSGSASMSSNVGNNKNYFQIDQNLYDTAVAEWDQFVPHYDLQQQQQH